MFRIDKNLVNISPVRFMAITGIGEPAGEVAEEPPTETPGKQLNEEPAESFAESYTETPVDTEDEIPEAAQPQSMPEGPTREEQAEARAAEIIMEAEARAARLIEDAERRAGDIKREAMDEAEQVCEKARRSGYEKGATEAKAEMEAELTEKRREDDKLLRSVIDVIHTERMRILSELEGEVVRLTLAIAEKIIKLSDENDDKVFESMIVNALRQMNLEGKITLRVGVREYDRFFSSGSAVFVLGDGTTVTASVIKDTAMNDGDCIIDSDSVTLNVGMDSQLKYIELAFSGANCV